jgi:hypothetical protein
VSVIYYWLSILSLGATLVAAFAGGQYWPGAICALMSVLWAILFAIKEQEPRPKPETKEATP